MKKIILIVVTLFIIKSNNAQTKILFDASKAETAGNADWVIDADQNNLRWNPLANPGGTGDEANAQQICTPSSGINSATPETFWTGALSNWGIDCVNAGWQPESLPYDGIISYGNTSNAQDLMNYKTFVICEPNIKFTTSEKTAILNFVNHGGGLFMIADHANSDRNFDNWDSPQIFNDLMNANPFGMKFDSVDISENPTNFALISNDTILHGTYGNVTSMSLHNASTITTNATANSSVKGLVYRNSASNSGSTNIIVALCNYGYGRVVALTDSSPPDDGTGDPNDNLYNGYTGEAGGNHRRLIMNATYWLMNNPTTSTSISQTNEVESEIKVYPNPAKNSFNVEAIDNSEIKLFDLMGNQIVTVLNTQDPISVIQLSNGIYIVEIINKHTIFRKKIVVNH